jgi:hypothetical protein
MSGEPRGLFGFSAIDLVLKEEGVTELNSATSDGFAPPDQVRGRAPPAGPSRLSPKLAFASQSLPSARRCGHKLSRRALLAGACALPLLRHPELVSGSSPPPPGRVTSWTLKQVQGDEGGRVKRWAKALAGFRQADETLEAAGLKLELIVRHHVFEASFGEAAIASLRRDIGRSPPSPLCGFAALRLCGFA